MESTPRDDLKIVFPISLYDLFNGVLATVCGSFILVSVVRRWLDTSLEPKPLAVWLFLVSLILVIIVAGLHHLSQRVQVDATGVTIRRFWGRIAIAHEDIHHIEFDEWVYKWRKYAPALITVNGRRVRVSPRITLSKPKAERYRSELQNAIDAFDKPSAPPAEDYDFSSNPFF